MKRFIIIGLILVLMFSLCACGPSEAPDKVVSTTLDAVKTADSQTASKYIDFNTILTNADIAQGGTEATKYDSAKALLKNMSYKIVSTSTGINSATVKTEITNIDMAPVLREYVTQSFTLMQNKTSKTTDQYYDQVNQILIDLINKSGNAKTTKTIDIQLENNNGTWKIKLTDDLNDAILGGATSFITNINNSIKSASSSSSTSNSTKTKN